MRKKRRFYIFMIIISFSTIIGTATKLQEPEPRKIFDTPPVVPTSFPDPNLKEEQDKIATTPENERNTEQPEISNDPQSDLEQDFGNPSSDFSVVELG